MSEELVIRQCSPTMAGIKSGNLFTCPAQSRAELTACLRKWNKRLLPRGVKILPLKFTENRALIYMYRPHRLQKDWQSEQAQAILRERQYPTEHVEKCVRELIFRLNTRANFPHEIGLFLGYPPEDVRGFIQSKAQGAKCVGTWKVYGDEETARRQFALYEKCTGIYRGIYRRSGLSDKLIVRER